jgi:hypothetical protein
LFRAPPHKIIFKLLYQNARALSRKNSSDLACEVNFSDYENSIPESAEKKGTGFLHKPYPFLCYCIAFKTAPVFALLSRVLQSVKSAVE